MSTPRTLVRIGLLLFFAVLVVERFDTLRSLVYAQLGRAIGVGIPLVLFLSLAVLWMFYYRAAKRRFYEQVAKARFLVCWDCGYLMTGLPNMHACPECGRVFTAHLDAEEWKRWMEIDDPEERW
ncbi:MAG: hypothetical protein JNG88_14890 [Phycisphaerales bacterium]|nr:hypothetical protein [Phycisphaerales bacterium]